MKKRYNFWVCFIALLIVSIGVLAKEPEKIELRLRYQAGQVFGHRLTMDQTIKQNIGGQDVELKQTIITVIGQEVQSVDDMGNANVSVSYRSIYYKQTSAFGTLEYDSKKPSETLNPAFYAFAALVGEKFNVRYSPRGEILAVGGLDVMTQKIISKLNLPEGSLRDNIVKVCNESGIKESLMQNATIYPQSPVGVGGSWTQQLKTTTNIPMSLQNTFTVKKIESNNVILEGQTVVNTNTDAPPMDMGGLKVRYSIQGTQKGTTKVDRATGQIQRADYVQDLSGTVSMEGSPDQPGMSWPITMSSKILMEYVQ